MIEHTATVQLLAPITVFRWHGCGSSCRSDLPSLRHGDLPTWTKMWLAAFLHAQLRRTPCAPSHILCAAVRRLKLSTVAGYSLDLSLFCCSLGLVPQCVYVQGR